MEDVIKFKKRIESAIERSYMGNVVLLPFLDDKKMLELEINNRQLNSEEETENKWGDSYLFNKNELNVNDIHYTIYQIYNNKTKYPVSNYHEAKKCDFSFPTLKTIDYDYEIINIKQYT